MEIIIQKSKNGENTAIADGHFLHSNYAPVKEAQRFVENLTLPFIPKIIILLEPALSYAADFLHSRFPDIKLGVIRYQKDFEEYNLKFDFVFNFFESKNFEARLERSLNEEQLLSTLFFSWPASSQIFKDTENQVWKDIKAALEHSKTLLITRQYFEKKWLLNSFNFIANIKHTVNLQNKINKDLLIIASGPSLKPFINYIQENQNKFFIICLSSAISVCFNYNIKPDLYMTTDGGFWAGEHLKKLYKTNIPVAMPAEAFCSKNLLCKLRVLPLIYDDGISRELTEISGVKYKRAVRNGTVSGTALLFAIEHSQKNIYMCGLDMANQKGFQHTQPNELETNSAISDCRIKTKETRLARSELTTGSLDIYKNWFISNQYNLNQRKVLRLIENDDRKNSLGWIQDINLKEFKQLSQNLSNTKDNIFTDTSYTFDSVKIKDFITQNSNNQNWKHQLFPLDYVSLSHNNENLEMQNIIETEWKNLSKKISGIVNENI